MAFARDLCLSKLDIWSMTINITAKWGKKPKLIAISNMCIPNFSSNNNSVTTGSGGDMKKC